MNTGATVSADGETITIHIPLTFRTRGGRKLVVMPDGAEWAPRPRVASRLESSRNASARLGPDEAVGDVLLHRPGEKDQI